MQIPFVDLKAQYESIKEEINASISKVFSNSAFIGGPFVSTFEKEFADFCDVKHCIGVGNGTDAIFIALKVLGVDKGDEVITAANSFIATSEAISMTGASIVFVDINPATYNIDACKIEEKINSKTKVIVAVHLYGQPADMDPILDIAKKNNLKVIEDAAQAHGAIYKNRTVGSLGDVACFSFYPGKNLGAYGDAGAIVTDNEEFALKARKYANHGRIDKYNHEFEGINSRLDGIQGAILSVKLKCLTKWNNSRRRNASIYNHYLKNSDLTLPIELGNIKAVYHLYVVRAAAEKRSELQDFLKKAGINIGIHYPIALPYLSAYTYLNHSIDDYPEAIKSSKEILSLPMFPELTESQVRYIADKITEFNLCN